MSIVPGPECKEEKIVFLTCQSLAPDVIFSNGLNQNVIFLYQLFELVGWKPYLLVNGPMDSSKLATEMRWITLDKYIQEPFDVSVLLEIGINMSKKVRSLFKMMGARVIKLYLGNTLNIDTEMCIYSPGGDVILHSVGELDMVLTSPHYASQLEYLRCVNGLEADQVSVAPYVWEPTFIGEGVGAAPPKDILIFEPNISFQKCCVVPLLICEKYYLENLSFSGKIHLFNVDKYEDGSNFYRNLLDRLRLWKDGRIVLHGRCSVKEIMEEYPNSVILCHQTNNEYNYMYLEAFYRGFSLVHNAESWSSGGFYYEGDDILGGATALGRALNNSGSVERRRHENDIIMRHSIFNTANQEGWLRLLEGEPKILTSRC